MPALNLTHIGCVRCGVDAQYNGLTRQMEEASLELEQAQAELVRAIASYNEGESQIALLEAQLKEAKAKQGFGNVKVALSSFMRNKLANITNVGK